MIFSRKASDQGLTGGGKVSSGAGSKRKVEDFSRTRVSKATERLRLGLRDRKALLGAFVSEASLAVGVVGTRVAVVRGIAASAISSSSNSSSSALNGEIFCRLCLDFLMAIQVLVADGSGPSHQHCSA
eukprot:scaffold2066_cov229-Ochromonas_danica.AAC.30